MMTDTALVRMKRCARCREWKSLDRFAYQDSARGTRHAYCRTCHATYRRAHYDRNRSRYIQLEVLRLARRRSENKRRLCAYLREHPCVDCGEARIEVLELDHRDPATKREEVTRLANHRSWKAAAAEIEKCEVRCANCHRRRTAEQFAWKGRLGIFETSRE